MARWIFKPQSLLKLVAARRVPSANLIQPPNVTPLPLSMWNHPPPKGNAQHAANLVITVLPAQTFVQTQRWMFVFLFHQLEGFWSFPTVRGISDLWKPFQSIGCGSKFGGSMPNCNAGCPGRRGMHCFRVFHCHANAYIIVVIWLVHPVPILKLNELQVSWLLQTWITNYQYVEQFIQNSIPLLTKHSGYRYALHGEAT